MARAQTQATQRIRQQQQEQRQAHYNARDIHLDDETYQALSEHFDSTLYDRVVREIVDELPEDKAAELAHLQTTDEGVNQWLIANVPALQEIVSDEIDILLGEIAKNSEQISE